VPSRDKLLGVTLDSSLTTEQYTSLDSTQLQYHMHALRHIRPLLTLDARCSQWNLSCKN